MGNEVSEDKASDVSLSTQLPPNKHRKWFIAVHCGAGNYSAQNVAAYRELMKRACQEAAKSLMQNEMKHDGSKPLSSSPSRALDAVCTSISVLENSELTNAGTGSNLNEKGQVECDACVALYQKGRHKSRRSKTTTTTSDTR